MEYVTLKISTAQGPIYEKDFRLEDVFLPLVQTLASRLAELGLWQAGQYQVSIRPGYVEPARFDLAEFKYGPEIDANASLLASRVNMDLPAGEQPSKPMRYFTVILQTLPPNSRMYCKDFPLTALNYLSQRVAIGLQQMGLVKANVAIVEYFAQQGDTPQFDKEIIHALPAEPGEIIITVDTIEPEESFVHKARPNCTDDCPGGSITAGSVIIFYKKDGLLRLDEHIRQSASCQQETGGILIGRVYYEPKTDQQYIEIEDFIPAKQTKANAVLLKFTHETWQQLLNEKQERFSDDQHVVGWYHTHCPIALSGEDKEEHTALFFSRDDVEMHRQIFDQPWQVAMVIDATSGEKVFFRWEGGSVVKSVFHIFA